MKTLNKTFSRGAATLLATTMLAPAALAADYVSPANPSINGGDRSNQCFFNLGVNIRGTDDDDGNGNDLWRTRIIGAGGTSANKQTPQGSTNFEVVGGNITALPALGSKVFFVIQDRPSNSEMRRFELTPALLRSFPGGGANNSGFCGRVADRIEGIQPNQDPTADAGANRTGTLPRPGDLALAVTLDGTNSSDPDAGDTLTFSWTLLSGPPSTFADATKAGNNSAINVSPPAMPGTQVWQLTVDDGNGGTDTDTVEIVWSAALNRAPTVTASGPATVLFDPSGGTAQTATLTAITGDPDGDPITRNWVQTAGPAAAILSGQGSGTLVISEPASAGVVTYEITVDDGRGGTATDSVSVDWVANTPPVNGASADQSPTGPVVLGSPVPLSSGNSSDADSGQTLTYTWTQTGGTSVALSNPNAANPTFPAPAGGGTLTFTVEVSDGVNTTTQTVTVTLAIDQTPIADAGADQTLVDVTPGTVVTLDGSGSVDPDGGTLSYSWVQVSGPSVTLSDPNAASPTFVFPRPGGTKIALAEGKGPAKGQPAETLVFELTVTDGTLSASDQTTVIINTNLAPTANAGADQTFFGLDNGDTVQLDGSASSDPDGDSLTYSWTVTSGSATLTGANTATPTLTYTGNGTDLVDEQVVVELIVNDGSVDSAADSVTLTFNDNRAPTANAGADQTNVNEGDVVTLNASASSDPDGDSLTYSWTQISGPSVALSSTSAASPTFTAPDISANTSLVFEVTVDDGKGLTSSDRVTIGLVPRGTISIVQVAQGGDSRFPFTSTIVPLSAVIQTQNGSGSLSSGEVAQGTYRVTAADTRGDGFALTGISCTDGDSTFDLGARQATIVLSPGEDVTCTFTSVNSRGAAKDAIRTMVTQRSALILSNGPDRQRRFDRLNGAAPSGGGLTAGGFTLPGSSRLPFTANITERGMDVSGSLLGAKNMLPAMGDKSGKFDIWAEATFAQFDGRSTDGNFSIIHLGADYLASDRLLIGVMASFDSFDMDGAGEGDGFLIGPYVTAKLQDNLYFDGRVQFGASDNSISPLGSFVDDFETDRLLLAGSLTGEFNLREDVLFQPTVEIRHLTETQNAYTDTLGVGIAEEDFSLGEVSFAPRLERTVALNNGWTFSPYGQVEGIIAYGDNAEEVLGDTFRIRVEGGGRWSSERGVSAGISAFSDGLGSDEFSSYGLRLRLSYTMQ